MRTLYHYRFSPFSRRVRLALAHKGLDVELREGRDDPAHIEEARKLSPLRTLPVYVDDGRVLSDSSAIVQWLDRAYPKAPRLWPDGELAGKALQTAALVDVVLDNVINPGTRYWALRDHPAWTSVRDEMIGRARSAADALAAIATTETVAGPWSAADIYLLTMTLWFESMPERRTSSPNIAQILTLGFSLPPALSHWADAHRKRPDVLSLQER
jgi:glutathione S-transferase